MGDRIRLGIIGFGNMGSAHGRHVLDGLCPDFALTAVADPDPSRLELAGTLAAGRPLALFGSAADMLDSGLVDACIVATPHYLHPMWVMECVRRGVHVMCEKPAGVYTKQVRAMNEEAARHPEAVFGMMFNQRTDCVYRKLRELTRSGRYGRIRRANWLITDWYRPAAYYASGAWRATWAGEGGGVLLNQCPHQLDLWQWICGMPARVQAHMRFGQWHDIEVEDDVTAYMEYADGSTGAFITSTGDAHGTNRFEIQMDGAQLVVEDGRLRVLEYGMSEPEFSATNRQPFGTIPARPLDVETDGQNLQHIGVLNAWGGAILGRGSLVTEGAEGIRGLTLSNAMHLSAFLGRAVDLPFDEDLFYEELMRRAAASRRKLPAGAAFADLSGAFGGAAGG